MEYTKTNVNAFGGLDANKRPELLQNEQASDIENLRFDKVGYLINRNGVKANPLKMVNPIAQDVWRSLWPIGTLGMTEYILKAPWGVGSGTSSWAPYDDSTLGLLYPSTPNAARYSDKFMVYQVRIPSAFEIPSGQQAIQQFDMYDFGQANISGNGSNPDNHYTWRYKAAYVLVPLTGPDDFRDTVAIAPNGLPYVGLPSSADLDYPSMLVTIGARSILRADDKPSRTQIYAPQRWLGVHNTFEHDGIPKDQNWIEHYTTMHQYRDTIVISDMTNKDLQLVDEYSEAEYSEERKHRFTLRENALAKFDVDDVVVDFGLGTTNNVANFNEKGVKAPLALYKFYLPRRIFTTSNDNYGPVFNGLNESPTAYLVRETPAGDFSAWKPLEPEEIKSFMAIESFYSEDPGLNPDKWLEASITINCKDRYTFTNNEQMDQYDDLFGKVTLKNPDIKQDDQVSSDVYLWKDVEIDYYPCSGASNLYGRFLTGQDRTWNKTSSNSSKVVKLKTHTGIEQNVPLGVWRYRFVWYLGNGEYSAPSAELVVPDMLFSGIKDSDIISAVGAYKRPIGNESTDECLATAMDLSSATNVFMNDLQIAQGIKIFENDGPPTTGTLTGFGSNFIKIKEKLYNSDHRFGALDSSTSGVSWPTDWSTEDYLAKGNVTTLCTLYFPSNDVTLEGVFAEAAHSKYTWTAKTVDFYKPKTVNLNIPIFKREAEDYTYNSLLTDSGVIRTIYQNRMKYQASSNFNLGYMAYDIVFTGTTLIGNKCDVSEADGKIYLNVVAFANAFQQDQNNSDDDELYNSNFRLAYRNMTQVRGVSSQGERLSYLKTDIPEEVASRILLTGTAEIPICDHGDAGTWRPQKTYRKLNNDTDELLAYNVKREYLDLNDDPMTMFLPLIGPVVVDNTEYVRINDPNYNTNNAYVKFSNLKVALSAQGERLVIHEQLSMYMPASLLFDAPHIKIVIPANRIPRRARQLMVFRTRASHDNAWQPHDYGLVKAIDIIRDKDTGLPSGTHSEKIDFIDDVKSEDMDFSYDLNDYEGFTEPIASRFCLPLNERVFYANIKESYRPKAPRNSVNIVANPADVSQTNHKNINFGSETELQKIWTNKIIYGDTATVNITKRYLYYFIAYNDAARSYSQAAFSGLIDRGDLQGTSGAPPKPNNTIKVLHYCLPSAYDASIEHLNIYRVQLDAPLNAVPFAGRQSQFRYPEPTDPAPQVGYFYVAQGVVEYNGVVYFPNSVIKTEHGGDTGVPRDPFVPTGMPSYLNRFVNYFSQTTAPYQPLGKTNRGAMASYSTPVIYDITNFFNTTTGAFGYLEKIGDIVPEKEGIFYDDDLPAIGRVPLLQFFQNQDVMPAGLRWSEAYQPNKIKLGSLMEVRSGDGDQITGMVQLYGNIVILKERSLHRLAVQGSSVPVSRVDEISNNVGCIAPNTAITVDNTLYFLSWAGFYKYDNNVLSKLDGAFAEELQVRLRSNIDGVSNPAIRDASCGWNPTYREIYLNIPVMSTNNSEEAYGVTGVTGSQGITLMDNVGTRTVRSMVYAINVDTGFVTKYRYMDDALYFTDPSGINPVYVPTLTFLNAPTQRAPRVASRVYYTNTLGQMRSAECLPPRTYNYNVATKPGAYEASISYLQTSFYIESPTKESNSSFDKYSDDMFFYTETQQGSGVWYNGINSRNVRVFWQSKSFTAEDKTVLKRVRKVFSYISSNIQPAVIRGVVHTSPSGGKMTTDTAWEYSYWFTNPLSPAYGQSATGELSAIPTEDAGASTSASQNRGERHMFQVEGGGSFQMEYFGFYWKPVNTYQR